jgi:hypothetical protein
MNIANSQSSTIVFNVATGSDETIYDGPVDPDSLEYALADVVLIPNSAISTDASNYRTTEVKVGSTVVASQTTNSSGGSARVAGTPQRLTISATGKAARFTAGTDVVSVVSTKTGTGAVEDCTIKLVWEKVRQ